MERLYPAREHLVARQKPAQSPQAHPRVQQTPTQPQPHPTSTATTLQPHHRTLQKQLSLTQHIIAFDDKSNNRKTPRRGR